MKLCRFPSLQRGATCLECGYILLLTHNRDPGRVCHKPGTKPPRESHRPRVKTKSASEQPAKPCNEPGLATLAYNYGTAYKKWKRAGKPRRSAEEIERIHAICQACEHFVAGVRPHCGLCGCTCSEGQNPLLNKLAMATEEQCPDNPPRWVSPMPANLVKSGDETNQGT